MVDSIELTFYCDVCNKKIPYTVPAFTEIEHLEDARLKHQYPIDAKYYKALYRGKHNAEHFGPLDEYGIKP